jgi:hypothetical protein
MFIRQLVLKKFLPNWFTFDLKIDNELCVCVALYQIGKKNLEFEKNIISFN